MFQFSLVLAIAAAGGQPPVPPLMMQKQHREGAVFALTGKQIDDYRAAALSGDGRRASQLANHYAYVAEDLVDAEFWAHLAAESGGCREISDYLPYLREVAYLKSVERLRVWRERRDAACKIDPRESKKENL